MMKARVIDKDNRLYGQTFGVVGHDKYDTLIRLSQRDFVSFPNHQVEHLFPCTICEKYLSVDEMPCDCYKDKGIWRA